MSSTTTTPKGVRQQISKKTTLRMGKRSQNVIDEVLVDAGVSRNAFCVLAILKEAVVLAHRIQTPKRVLDKLEAAFNRELAEARAELS